MTGRLVVCRVARPVASVPPVVHNGVALTPSSLELFVRNPYVLIVTAILIMAGNTFTPIFLRSVVWVIWRCSPATSTRKLAAWKLLEQPRSFYTHLFSHSHTKWLLIVQAALMTIQVALFILLDWNTTEFEGLTSTQRMANIVFAASSTRTAGLNAINLQNLSFPTVYSIIVSMSR